MMWCVCVCIIKQANHNHYVSVKSPVTDSTHGGTTPLPATYNYRVVNIMRYLLVIYKYEAAHVYNTTYTICTCVQAARVHIAICLRVLDTYNCVLRVCV